MIKPEPPGRTASGISRRDDLKDTDVAGIADESATCYQSGVSQLHRCFKAPFHSAATEQRQNFVWTETIACGDDAHGFPFQFRRTVIGDGVSSMMVFIRK